MTYLNTYEMLKQLRLALNEYSLNLLQGSVAGAHDNDRLLYQLNAAQLYLFALLKKRNPDLFRETVSDLAVTSSVITLPANCGVIELLRDSSGLQIYPMVSKGRKRTNETGSGRYYYREGNTLTIDKAGITGTVELIYFKRCPQLTYGQAQAASGLASLVMASSARGIIDYYNGVTIENITGEFVDEITDYTAARVATVTGTWTEDDWYGTLSTLPEDFHPFIVDFALILERKDNPRVQIKPGVIDIKMFNLSLSEVLTSFGHSAEDIDIADVFEDFGPTVTGGNFLEL
jgi:hypothetical protein